MERTQQNNQEEKEREMRRYELLRVIIEKSVSELFCALQYNKQATALFYAREIMEQMKEIETGLNKVECPNNEFSEHCTNDMSDETTIP
jgi:hypothetical protein